MNLFKFSRNNADVSSVSDSYDLSLAFAELSLLIEVENIFSKHSNIECVRDWMGSVVVGTYHGIRNRNLQYGNRGYGEYDDDLPLYLVKFFEKYTEVSDSLDRNYNASLLPGEEITRENIETLKIESIKKIESYYRKLDNKMWVLI